VRTRVHGVCSDWTAEAGGSLLSNGSVHLRIKDGGGAPAPSPSTPPRLITTAATSPAAASAGGGGGGGRGEGPAATFAAADAEALQPSPLLGSAEWVGPLGRHDDGRSPYFKLGMCASLPANDYEPAQMIRLRALLCLLTLVNARTARADNPSGDTTSMEATYRGFKSSSLLLQDRAKGGSG
jgi:hypothetical protein